MAPNLLALCAELHFRIYSFACMDDGRTGCALSAVSKLVRELSGEYRYQSVAIAGREALSVFRRELEALPPQLRRVRHLFICDHFRSSATPSTWAVSYELRLINSLSLLNSTGLERNPDADAKQAIFDILGTVSTTLLTLTLVSFTPHFDHGDSRNHILLLDHSFPSLLELTVRGPHVLPNSDTFAPLLERLHISDQSLPQHFNFGRSVALNHPSLSHVRISRSWTSNSIFEPS